MTGQPAQLYFEGKRIVMPWELKFVPGWTPELTVAGCRYPVRGDVVVTDGQAAIYATETIERPGPEWYVSR